MTATKTWLITGASKGLGLALTHQLLAAGHRVAATTRNKALLEKEVGITSPQFLPLSVDLSDEASVKCAVNQALDHFGSIDVVVNNAGFGQMGTLEELSDAEARKSFDINVFGMLNVIRSVMPHLRARRSGHIMNISSMAGIQGHIPGWGVYCAAKFAVAGFTEALAAESAEFDIKVTLVYPGHMRTRFLSQGSIMSPENPIADYLTVRENEKRVKEQMDGQQIGDPEKAAALLIKISQVDNPPLHFFIGEDAYQAANTKLNSVKHDLAIWEADTLSIGF